MAWGLALKTFAKGAVKDKARKIATDKLLNRKKKKGQRRKAAQDIMQQEEGGAGGEGTQGGGALTIRPTTKAISVQKLLPDPTFSATSSGVSSLDKVLDNIDNELLSLINTVKGINKVQKKSSDQNRKDVNKRWKRMRENIFENKSKFMNKVPSGMKKTMNTMKTFINNIVLGSLIVYVLQQWDNIVKWYKNTVKKIEELWKKLDPIVQPIWDFMKWFGKFSIDWTARLLGIEEPDKQPIEDNLKAIDEKINPLKESFDKLTGAKKELEDSSKGVMMDKMKQEESNTTMDSIPPPPAGEVRQQSSIPPKDVYDYLISKGVSDNHARGMLANIQAESSFRPGVIGDSGTSGGLFQHHATRFDAMKSFVGKDWKTNWQKQIDFSLQEREGKAYLKKQFSSPQEASKDFTLNFEIPANANQKAKDRIKHVGTFKLSQGLDMQTSYEVGGSNNIILVNNSIPANAVPGSGGSAVLIPIPLKSSGLQVASALHQYQLQTT